MPARSCAAASRAARTTAWLRCAAACGSRRPLPKWPDRVGCYGRNQRAGAGGVGGQRFATRWHPAPQPLARILNALCRRVRSWLPPNYYCYFVSRRLSACTGSCADGIAVAQAAHGAHLLLNASVPYGVCAKCGQGLSVAPYMAGVCVQRYCAPDVAILSHPKGSETGQTFVCRQGGPGGGQAAAMVWTRC